MIEVLTENSYPDTQMIDGIKCLRKGDTFRSHDCGAPGPWLIALSDPELKSGKWHIKAGPVL